MKALTKVELEILEELDGYNRVRLALDRDGFASMCRAGFDELSTPFAVIQVINRLVRRGLIQTGYRRYIYLTDVGKQLITRHKVFHLKQKDGKRRDGFGNSCSERRKCPDCRRVAFELKAKAIVERAKK